MVELSTLLPFDAAMMLKLAAQTPVTANDPLARVRAVEEAVERIKRNNTERFHDENGSRK
jgi:hypothetical protein